MGGILWFLFNQAAASAWTRCWAVEEGGYSDPEGVVAAALSDWIARGRPPAMTTARLRELVDEADRAGDDDGDFDVEALIQEMHSARK